MGEAVKDRLITAGLAGGALVFLIYSVRWAHTTLEASLNLRPWAHMTLESSVNLLWLLLAVGVLAHWLVPDGSRRDIRLPGLVNLVFVLSLLFPVISANDDLARLDLINDAKSLQPIVASLKSEKHLTGSAELLDSLPALAVQLASSLSLRSEFVSEPACAASVATPGDATGNHSPPLC